MELSSKKDYFVVEFFVAFLVVFGVVMFLPMFPNLQETFGVTVSKIAWLPNIGYLTMILFSPLVGKVIKKIGAKKLLLFCLFLWVAGICIELLAIKILSYGLFVFGRFIEGIGEATFFPILLSINKAVMKEEKDSKIGASLIETGSAIGGLIAAILAGYFLNSPQVFLLIPIALGVMVWIFVLLKIKEVVLEEREDLVTTGAGESKKAYISLLFMIFGTQMVFASSQVFLAYYMEIFAAVNRTGFLISLEQILIAVGTIVPVILLKRLSFIDIRNILLVVFLLGSVLLAMQISFGISVISLLIITLFVGIGFTTLNIYLSRAVVSNASQKMSLYTSVRFAAGFFLSFTWGKFIEVYRNLGHSYSETFYVLYLITASLAVVIFFIVYLLQKEDLSFWKSRDLTN
ncbi:MFS transporter [Clostridium sp. A1-XYC3]|uniref:MFS transporter n=1 Tax=Clostridium tanneri TaxID=3037988 RepID=A0ABU4JQT1_9CLOT|nr:MFS transporter [Clostridium sp. A1-XYC3]MDW8800509.1 MFS transporter [Clostridium sp. A1-XYC3]